MTVQYFYNRILPFEGYNGLLNWNVSQPLFRKTTAEYIADARELSSIFEEKAKNFADSLGIGLHVKIAEPKSHESAERKLWDRTSRHFGRPEMIKDYGRGSLTVPKSLAGVEHVNTVITELVHSSNTVAYKDQFLNPNPDTGYRSFKAIWELEGHNFELLVEYEGMEPANQLTKNLRNIERTLRDIENDLPRRCTSRADKNAERTTAKMTGQIEETIKAIRHGRKGISELYASECGLNALLAPESSKDHGTDIARLFLSAAKTTKHSFAKPVIAVIDRAEQYFSSPEPYRMH